MIKRTRVSYQIGATGTVISRPVISQGDEFTNIIDFEVKEGTQPYNLEALGLSVTFYFIDKQGNYLPVPADTIADNVATVEIPQSIIEFTGQIDIEVEITDSIKVLNATGFSIQIDPTRRKAVGTFPTNPFVVAWNEISGKPSVFPPVAHTHKSNELGLGFVDVTDYGAVGDGVTDDSQAILDAIQALPDVGGTLFFPPGIYLHGDGIANPTTGTGNTYEQNPSFPERPLTSGSTPVGIGRDIRLRFIDKVGLTILGYGATIRSHPDNGEVRNNSIFYFQNPIKLRVYGINIDGNKVARQPIFNDYSDGSGSSSRGNFSIAGGDDIVLQDVRSDGSMMDGFYIAGYEGEEAIKGVRVINCSADNCYRNGLTFSNSKGAQLFGGSFTNTGQTYGTAPMVGIDIEADWSTKFNDDCIIDGAYFTGNVVAGGAFSFGSRNCKFVNCTFENQSTAVGYTFDTNRMGHNFIENCHLINSSLSTEPNAVTIRNNIIELRPTVASGGTYEGLFFELQGNDVTPSSFVVIEDNIFKVDLSNVSATATSVRAGYMNFRSRKNIVFKGNTIINLYSAGTNTQSCFIYGWYDGTFGNQVIKDNTFLFKHDALLATCLPNTFIDIGESNFANFAEGNLIRGYPVGASQRGGLHRFNTLQTGSQQEYNQMVTRNEYYKFDPRLMSTSNSALNCHFEMRFDYLDETVIVEGTAGQFNFSVLKYYVEGKPVIGTPTWLTIWSTTGALFFRSTVYYVNVTTKVKYSGGNASYYMSNETHPIRLAVSGDVTSLTPRPYTLHVTSVTTVSSVSDLSKQVGQSVYHTGVSKPIWWNGTVWVDSAGTTVT